MADPAQPLDCPSPDVAALVAEHGAVLFRYAYRLSGSSRRRRGPYPTGLPDGDPEARSASGAGGCEGWLLRGASACVTPQAAKAAAVSEL